jgi:DNA-binding GntR family transcriptional regulator
VIHLRCLLEGSAVELAVASLAPARLRELERLHQRFLGAIEDGRGRDIVGGNEAWHHALYEASGSSLLCEFIRRLWDVYPWRTMWVLPGRGEQSAHEHEEIMEAVRAGDPARAADRMQSHIAGGLISLADDA